MPWWAGRLWITNLYRYASLPWLALAEPTLASSEAVGAAVEHISLLGHTSNTKNNDRRNSNQRHRRYSN